VTHIETHIRCDTHMTHIRCDTHRMWHTSGVTHIWHTSEVTHIETHIRCDTHMTHIRCDTHRDTHQTSQAHPRHTWGTWATKHTPVRNESSHTSVRNESTRGMSSVSGLTYVPAENMIWRDSFLNVTFLTDIHHWHSSLSVRNVWVDSFFTGVCLVAHVPHVWNDSIFTDIQHCQWVSQLEACHIFRWYICDTTHRGDQRKIFGFPDWTVFLSTLLSDGDSRLLPKKNCFEILGNPVKSC